MYSRISWKQPGIYAQIMNKNCIVVYATCGEGHKKAAEALADRFCLPCLDFLDFTSPFVKRIYSAGYRFLVERFPFAWNIAFESSKTTAARAFLGILNSLLFVSFTKFLRDNKPGYIIATHFFPIQLVKRVKKKLGLKLLVVITDLGMHPLWADVCVDYYFVAMDITKRELISLGIDKDRIAITGLPLRAGFLDNVDGAEVRKSMSLDSKPAILILSSTQGNIYFLREMIDELSGDFNLIFICGNNKKTKSFLAAAGKSSVRFFEYYENIWELMEIASLVITKPGGLTVFESLHKRKYMIFTHFIPGQEEKNMEALKKLGAGFYTATFAELKEKVYTLIRRGDSYNFSQETREDIFLAVKNITGINEC